MDDLLTSAEPESVSQFLEVIEDVHQRWVDKTEEDYSPWFRGQPDASFVLVPGLYRPDFHHTDENSFRHEFRLKAFPYLQDATYPPVTDWDWYFLMQHHGLPTRLLDWTESALTGLYFALSGSGMAQRAVWMLNPWKLNEYVAGIGETIPTSHDGKLHHYLQPPWSNQPLPIPPAALQPPFNSRRISAQRGMFTIHGSATASIESYQVIGEFLCRILIPQDAVETIRDQLGRAGIGESTLFPELAGLCREIRDQWKGVS